MLNDIDHFFNTASLNSLAFGAASTVMDVKAGAIAMLAATTIYDIIRGTDMYSIKYQSSGLSILIGGAQTILIEMLLNRMHINIPLLAAGLAALSFQYFKRAWHDCARGPMPAI